MIGIYKITFPNNKVYIGQGLDLNDKKIYYSRINSYRNFGSKLRACFDTYQNNYSFDILEECEKINLNFRERFYQELYDSVENGLNVFYTSNVEYRDKGTCNLKKDKKTFTKMLHLSDYTIKTIAKRAVDEGTNFKNLSESILEDYANNKLISKLQSDSLTKCADEALKSKLTIKK